MKKKRPYKEVAEAVVARLRRAGHTALFAGGCVRDLAMNRPPKDYDIATDAVPDQVVRLFSRTEKVGAKFGVVIVRQDGYTVEVATFRSDGDYADGRHPQSVRFSDPLQDALRRDFTINGMFFDPAENRIIDQVGGLEDLRRRVVRAIGDPHRRFAEDHLRMLRAVRFAARLSFEIEPATAEAIRAVADRIRLISPERVRAELAMILADPSRRRGWELTHETGLSRWLVEDTSWTDDQAAAVAARLGRLGGDGPDALVLAVVFGKYAPIEAAARCRKLTCSNQVVRGVAWLLEELPRILACEAFEPADFKLLLADPCCGNLVALAEAEIAGGGLSERPLSIWRSRTAAIAPADIAPVRLVTGDDLLAMGYEPGPAFKRVLAELYRQQLNGRRVNRADARAAARDLMVVHQERP